MLFWWKNLKCSVVYNTSLYRDSNMLLGKVRGYFKMKVTCTAVDLMRRLPWGPRTTGWAPPHDPGPVSVHGAQVTLGGSDSVSSLRHISMLFCLFDYLFTFAITAVRLSFVLPRALYWSSPGVDAQLIRAAPLQSAAPLTPSYDFLSFFFFFSRVSRSRWLVFSRHTAARCLSSVDEEEEEEKETCARSAKEKKNGLRTLLRHIERSDSVLLLVMLGCSGSEERFCRRSAVPCRIFTQRSSLESNGVTCSWKAPQRFR